MDITAPERLVIFDYIRGLGILAVIFVHGSVYHYGLIDELDISNLNPFFMIIYIILNWGGLFAILSGIVNTYSSFFRLKNNEIKRLPDYAWKVFGKRWVILGFLYLCINFIYNYFLSPFLYNFDTNTVSYSFFTGLIRTGKFYHVSAAKILQGSTFAMLGWNLIILGLFFTLLFKRGSELRKKCKKFLILALGIFIELISFVRIFLFDDFFNALQNGNYCIAYLIDIFAGEYFPLLPYLGYGLMGAYLGLLLTENPSKSIIRRQIWIGVGFILTAAITFLIPDAFYAKIGLLDNIFLSYITNLFEIGFFFIAGMVLLSFSPKKKIHKIEIEKKKIVNSPNILLIFSKNSLTFFLLERPIAEVFALIPQAISSDWNHYLWSCLLFGGILVSFWILIAVLWNKVNFKFSFEWWLVQLFQKIKYQSNKSF